MVGKLIRTDSDYSAGASDMAKPVDYSSTAAFDRILNTTLAGLLLQLTLQLVATDDE